MKLDAVTLSVMNAAFAGIAEEAGTVLVRSARSPNIKERRDCSAALFDAAGRMVAQAEHIPVHLGAMPDAVAAVVEQDPRPGDVFLLNDPYRGGTHLPDLTLVSAIEGIAFAVTRAHHSDVGGTTPGSMPAASTEIWQEGLVVPPVRLTDDILDLVLANVRTPETRRGDLLAQLAANRAIERRLLELIERRGRELVLAGFDAAIEYAEQRTRMSLRGLRPGRYEAESEVEGDGVTEEDLGIHCTVTIGDGTIEIDFEGTAGTAIGNVNCPIAVTRSACTFAVRTLLPTDIPPNAGMQAAIAVRAPEGCLVHARPPAAVVAGNVETSERIADTVLLALAQAADVPARGQGTMNNLVLGTPRWTYYETIGGGQGASATGDGDSGIHTGMSNTLNTPVEALEVEYPLRVERLELLDGSGGDGLHHGGDGIVRELRVLEACTLSLLTDRRRHGPRGAGGGADGRPGRNLVNGEPVPAKTTRRLARGDVVRIETPGGGGFDEPA